MLEVFKRRWKPKRASSNNNNYKGDTICNKNIADPVSDVTIEKLLSAPTSIRQIHPLEEEKTQLKAYSSDCIQKSVSGFCGTLPLSSGETQYLAPNICVEGGRIEFIKPPPPSECQPPASDYSSPPSYSFHDEKEDCVKECLEVRILELEESLDLERKAVQKERLINAKLQRQLSRAEQAQRDTERERRLRRESEAKLRSSIIETDRYRTKLNSLQKEFSRMEDTVRSMLEYKSRCEQLKQAKASLALSYENQIQHFQAALAKLSIENERLKRELRHQEETNNEEVQQALLERLQILERKNADLVEEAEKQRKQYEQYLDDIASQVVRALLAQKSLREEIETLHARSRDLETQNKTLTALLVRQMGRSLTSRNVKSLATSSSSYMALPDISNSKRPLSLDEAQLREWEETSVWLPLHRPHSLSLNITGPLLNHDCKKDIESPESGNRDEGYSTMSSDMQGTVELPKKGLEDVKEASDEAEIIKPAFVDRRSLDFKKPDILFFPLSLSLNISNSRHSYPPMKDILPYHHIMRSFSDSHLCLKFTTTSTAPMIISFDTVWSKNKLAADALSFVDDSFNVSTSCDSFNDWWDTDYIQHWLRIDDTRSALQQRLAYNTSDIEDWSMEQLDETTLAEHRKKAVTPNSMLISLPSIQENADYLEFIIDDDVEDDENLWIAENKYFTESDLKSFWPNFSNLTASPASNSWSSNDTNSDECGQIFNEFESNEGLSKRSSAVLSCDSGDSSVIGTDFTRDFYRLVKFESTKSLTSLSSKSQTNEPQKESEGRNQVNPQELDQEQTLQSVPNASPEISEREQQLFQTQEPQDFYSKDPIALKNVAVSKDELIDCQLSKTESGSVTASNDLFCKDQQIFDGICTKETFADNLSLEPSSHLKNDSRIGSLPVCSQSNNPSAETAALAFNFSETPHTFQSFSLPKNPVMGKIAASCRRRRPVSVEVLINDGCLPNNRLNPEDKENFKPSCSNSKCSPKVPKDLDSSLGVINSRTSSDISDSSSESKLLNESFDDEEEISCLSEESLSSFCSLSSLSDISLRHLRSDMNSRSSLNTVPEEEEVEASSVCDTSSNLSSFVTVFNNDIRYNENSVGSNQRRNQRVNFDVNLGLERRHRPEPMVPDSIVVKNGQRYSFNESASSKDVIDELNRMIRKGEESSGDSEAGSRLEGQSNSGRPTELDEACCCPTGWVHVEKEIDFTDPKARANLLDVMLASRHSSSSAEDLSSCESEEERSEYHHLRKLHRSRCQRKVATREPLRSSTREPLCGVLRHSMSIRPSIIDRDDFYVRFGEKERDALSFFDFLDSISTTTLSAASSCESNSELGRKNNSKTSKNEPQTSSQLHLSDSCATSYSDSE